MSVDYRFQRGDALAEEQQAKIALPGDGEPVGEVGAPFEHVKDLVRPGGRNIHLGHVQSHLERVDPQLAGQRPSLPELGYPGGDGRLRKIDFLGNGLLGDVGVLGVHGYYDPVLGIETHRNLPFLL